ncbi:MAG: GntR family transcriptional regulator [Spirochaetia bacterium]|nr:GntR family transcriptional regulator [Spirochaetia bacterium]
MSSRAIAVASIASALFIPYNLKKEEGPTSMATLYKMIYNELLQKINYSIYKVGDRLPTEKELSAQYHVSRITSKRALEELEKQGYVERVRGKGTFLRQESTLHVTDGLTNAIALIYPSDSDFGGFAASLDGASSVIEENGLVTHLYTRFDTTEAVEELLVSLKEDGTKGIIYYPRSGSFDYEIVNRFLYDGIPFATFDKYLFALNVPYVCSDNHYGGYLATSYLLELGHRKVAFISDLPLEDASSIRDRYLGYCQALKKYNLPYCPRYVSFKKGGRESMRSYDEAYYSGLISNLHEQGVSAIFAINDIVASFILRACGLLGYHIPGDFSLIGFDGLPFSQYQRVPITSVVQDFSTMGRCAAQIVINQLQGKPIDNKILPVKLVERASCRKLDS